MTGPTFSPLLNFPTIRAASSGPLRGLARVKFFFQYWDTVPFCMGSNFFERSHSSPVRNFRGSCFRNTFLEELSCATSSSRTVLQEMKYFLTLHRRGLKKCTMMKWSQKSPVTFQSTCIFDCKQSQSCLIPLSPHEMHAATQHQREINTVAMQKLLSRHCMHADNSKSGGF